jgi:hypothetical protein
LLGRFAWTSITTLKIGGLVYLPPVGKETTHSALESIELIDLARPSISRSSGYAIRFICWPENALKLVSGCDPYQRPTTNASVQSVLKPFCFSECLGKLVVGSALQIRLG